MKELREIPRSGFVPGRDETFHAVVQPIGREMLLFPNAAREVTNERRGLEERIHDFSRESCRERENHHRSAEQADLAGDTRLAEFIRKRSQRAENGFASKG